MNKKKDSVDKVEDNVFNGSLATLMRIDELIRHISIYRVNHHLLGFKENLGELLIESQGFLNFHENKKAWDDWENINNLKLDFDSDGNVIFDDSLFNALVELSSYLRLRLKKNKVTWAKARDFGDNFNNFYKKYGLR